MQEEHCPKAVTRQKLDFFDFLTLSHASYFFSLVRLTVCTCLTTFSTFSKCSSKKGARMPHSDRQRPVSAMRHVRRTGGMAAKRDSVRRRRRLPAPYNADVSTASNSGSLAQMSVALHRKASAHCTTLRRDPLMYSV